MTRKQRFLLLGATAALVTASLAGLGHLEQGQTALGLFILAGAAVGWIVLAAKLRSLLRGRPEGSGG
jgi:hypothetical protein